MARSKPKRNEKRDGLRPFERLLAEISTLFIDLPAGEIDDEIIDAQRRICESLDLDRSTLWMTSESVPGMLVLTHIHQPSEIPSPPEHMNTRDSFPWAAERVLAGETLAVARMTELPAEADLDRESFGRYGARSTVLIPLSVARGKVFGALTFAVTREERRWSRTLVQQLELVAQIFANALSRKQTEKLLEERLQFEMLLSDISARFVNLPPDRVDGAIEEAQRRVCESLGLDLCALWQWTAAAPASLIMTHIYRFREEPPLPQPMDAQEFFPWSREQLNRRNIIAIASLADLPEEAARDVESYRTFGIKSTCVFPLAVGNAAPIGALGFNAMRAEREWSDAIVKRLQLVAEIFTNALVRKRSQNDLIQSERRLRLITNALPVLISYVDTDLRYRFNNEAYQAWFGVDPQEAQGRSIPEVIGERFFQSARPYLQQALSGEPVQCDLEVERADGRPLSVEAIYVPDVAEQGVVRGIYVMATDVTERNLARQQFRRLQDELFHAARVATMGELTGALAHEINQPLSAIMSNAQAARRYLAGPTPNLNELKEILNDIIKEDARAGDVISRLRALLKKGRVEMRAVDLNSVFREVVALLDTHAVRGGIKVSSELDPKLPPVQGDRIQLQQVALNLLLNAFDAMQECPVSKRRVLIRTWRQDFGIVAAVADSGKGIPAGDSEKIFKAFYTTKPEGLGMGLSICRSIITNLHGRLWVETTSGRGATFCFRLPAATTRSGSRPPACTPPLP
ncbi:MAG: ATP-binding protein [Desulfobacterales bacterium]|nr:ATP-binding protein [Desulfobacterales bacterium]